MKYDVGDEIIVRKYYKKMGELQFILCFVEKI
jgi:hypothetical protein